MKRKSVIEVTGEQRAGMALWLSMPWQGTEDQLRLLAEVSEAFRTREVRVAPQCDPAGRILGLQLDFSGEREAERFMRSKIRVAVTPAMVGFLLDFYPGAQTPAPIGPAKVDLLKTLRAHVPKEKPKKR